MLPFLVLWWLFVAPAPGPPPLAAPASAVPGAPGVLRVEGVGGVAEAGVGEVAARAFEDAGGTWSVEAALAPPAARSLAELTASAVGEEVVVRVCGEVAARPLVMAPLDAGRFVIAGLTRAEADALVARLTGLDPCAGPGWGP